MIIISKETGKYYLENVLFQTYYRCYPYYAQGNTKSIDIAVPSLERMNNSSYTHVLYVYDHKDDTI